MPSTISTSPASIRAWRMPVWGCLVVTSLTRQSPPPPDAPSGLEANSASKPPFVVINTRRSNPAGFSLRRSRLGRLRASECSSGQRHHHGEAFQNVTRLRVHKGAEEDGAHQQIGNQWRRKQTEFPIEPAAESGKQVKEVQPGPEKGKKAFFRMV